MASELRKSWTERSKAQAFVFGCFVCGFVAGLCVFALGRAPANAEPPKLAVVKTDPSLQLGQTVYSTNCAACHGDKGDGKGPMARFLYPRPRNFGENKFRIVSTDNGKPSEEDLMHVINRGMPGSAMFPYGHLPESEKKALVTYLRELARSAFCDFAKQQAEAMDESVDLDELKQAAILLCRPGEPLTLPKDLPASSPESIARGAKLYAQTCAACHGATGKGDGVQAQKNDDGLPTRPRDLTRGFFKGGRDFKQVYSRIMLGMPGSPMPGSMQTLKPSDTADLTNFILALSTPQATALVEHQRTKLIAGRAKHGIPNDAFAAGWNVEQAQRIVVSPLWWRDHDDLDLRVSAMHDGASLAVRLSWKDSTRDSEIIRVEDFLDMAAVQLCDVRPEPFLGMGAEKGRVDLWAWRAGKHATASGPLDEYPFENPIYRGRVQGQPPDFLTARAAKNPNFADRPASNLAAKGAGSSTFLPPASQFVSANASWKDGRWTVVLRRQLNVADGLTLAKGKTYSIAFAIWDGSARDRSSQKFVSIWHDLKLEE